MGDRRPCIHEKHSFCISSVQAWIVRKETRRNPLYNRPVLLMYGNCEIAKYRKHFAWYSNQFTLSIRCHELFSCDSVRGIYKPFPFLGTPSWKDLLWFMKIALARFLFRSFIDRVGVKLGQDASCWPWSSDKKGAFIQLYDELMRTKIVDKSHCPQFRLYEPRGDTGSRIRSQKKPITATE